MLAYHLIQTRDTGQSLSVFGTAEQGTLTVRDDHPHFAAITELVADPEATFEQARDLADLSVAVARRFEHLSERVTVSNGHVYFDGDEVHGAITRQLVRALDAGDGASWRPLVRFLENIAANPTEHSRDQLFDWLDAREFTITRDGDVIAYKGVEDAGDGTFRSLWDGGAIVNGARVEGKVPQSAGDVIELPRSQVAHDPSESCSHGLHVGTYDYAHGYARGALLKVRINPRDVVSVPTDAGGDKVRVCRYRVVETIDAPETAWLDTDAGEDYCPECGTELDEYGDCPEADALYLSSE